jgi:hypothetical protein
MTVRSLPTRFPPVLQPAEAESAEASADLAARSNAWENEGGAGG